MESGLTISRKAWTSMSSQMEALKDTDTRQINTPEVTEGLPVRTGDTRQSTGESEPSVQVTDGGTGTGSNTSTEPQQTSTESQVEQ